jgi:protein-S-isoprenylcysteine O-methyltransferase Ste14
MVGRSGWGLVSKKSIVKIDKLYWIYSGTNHLKQMLMGIIIYLSFLFLLSEIILTLTKRSKKKSVKKKKDRGSMVLLWTVITTSLTAGFNLADYSTWNSLNYFISFFGLLLFLLGLIIRWTAIIQLKKAFTVDVAINQEHKLKTEGLYKIVRHPSYLGLLLIISGLSTGMNSLISFLVITIPVFLTIVYRINVEEAVLLEEFGSKYADYSKTTKKIIPYLF